jgi:hypothetical protein
MRLVERLIVRWARHLRDQGAEALCLSLPLVPAVQDALDMRTKEFLRVARLGFPLTQLFELDAQQRDFPPHRRYRIEGVRWLWRGKYAHEGMNVDRSGLIRHAQSVAKHGLQTVKANANCCSAFKRQGPRPRLVRGP